MIQGRGGQSILTVAESNKLSGIFPAALKNWWDCTESSGKILRDIVGDMDYRADIPAYDPNTGEFDETNNGGNLGTFSAIAEGAVRFTVDFDGKNGTTGGALSNHRLGDGAQQLFPAGQKPFIYMMHCKATSVVARNHLGINNVNLLQRINLGTSLISQPSSSTGVNGEDTNETTNWTNLDEDIVNTETALWALVSDGTNSQLYKSGVAQGAGVVNIHGNLSPTNAMGLSGIDELRGFSWLVFDTLPGDVATALSWMAEMWLQNKKVFWPGWL